MSEETQWEQVEPDAPQVTTLEPGDELIGYYLGQADSFGSDYDTKIHVFQLENDGERAGLWASHRLDSKLAKAEKGELVRVVFTGYDNFEKEGEARTIKQYDVFKSGKMLEGGTVASDFSPQAAEDDIPF